MRQLCFLGGLPWWQVNESKALNKILKLVLAVGKWGNHAVGICFFLVKTRWEMFSSRRFGMSVDMSQCEGVCLCM